MRDEMAVVLENSPSAFSTGFVSASSVSSAPILVAVDLRSKCANQILWASQLAQMFGASILITHVVHEPASEPGFYDKLDNSRDPLEPLARAAERMLGNLLNELRATHTELTVLHEAKTLLAEGLPVGRICEVATEHAAQLLVIGHRKRSWLKKFWEGSLAEKLLEVVEVPVVVIKD